jgi:predicted permease
MQNLIFSINGVAPVFLIIFLGFGLKKRGLINSNFVSLSSKIVFSVVAPVLVFESLSRTDLKITFMPLHLSKREFCSRFLSKTNGRIIFQAE